MTFDFYNAYKQYSNTELLKIVKRPENYQSDAVIAATQLLAEREVTEDEIQFVVHHYLRQENALRAKKEEIESYKNNAASILDPLLKPTEKIDPERWVHLLLLVSLLQYGWLFYNDAVFLIRLPKYIEYVGIGAIIFRCLNLGFSPFVCYLLFKRKKWGWILVFANCLFIILSKLSESYIFFRYWQPHLGDATKFLLPVVSRGALVLLLIHDHIKERFRIDQKAKAIGAGIAVILLALSWAIALTAS